MADEKPVEKEREIIFTEEWIGRNLTGLLRLLSKGYSLFSVFALLKEPVLPIRWIEVETLARSPALCETLTDSEKLLYFTITKATTPKHDKLKIARRSGAPTKKTGAVIGRILEALEAGLSRPAACGFAGIAPASLYNWVRDDEGFLEQIEYAEALGQARLELNIIRGTINNPGFALKVAERLYKEYVPKRQIAADDNLRTGLEAVAEALSVAGIEDDENDKTEDTDG